MCIIAGYWDYFTEFIERVKKMQARAPLMIEHRTIEQMLLVIKAVLAKSISKHEIDPVFVDTAVDFIKVYADRTHHGKEEDILFQRMRNKPLSANDLRIMNELIEEHRFARQTTAELVAANNRYRNGDNSALTEIAAKLKIFIEFYPVHIAKEDKEFFPSSRAYFTDEEDQAMLAEFWEFDRKMIHEKYRSVVEKLKNQQ
jgi:hemerythrin-like domain-containing protein